MLLSETTSWAGAVVAVGLRNSGHHVHVCHDDDDTGLGCVAMRGRGCPLEVTPIDVAVLVRQATPVLGAEGVRCAESRQVPVVDADSLLGAWGTWLSVRAGGTSRPM